MLYLPSVSHHAFSPLIYFAGMTLPHAQHSIRRKAYASHYTPSNLAKLQPEIAEATGQMIDGRCRFFTLPSTPCNPPTPASRPLILFPVVASMTLSTDSPHTPRWTPIDVTRLLSKWALEAEEGLTVAIGNFPKRGILVRVFPVLLDPRTRLAGAHFVADLDSGFRSTFRTTGIVTSPSSLRGKRSSEAIRSRISVASVVLGTLTTTPACCTVSRRFFRRL
ncbi:hypothetical protein B0H17DRAFT_1190306 [Mycena rosella]|uniref:Uncharacterized protein n=1 Tax=Mycena rosella TaxID=1033263 RepID=A0AAD7H2A7_MYCRO|nr:hypothetical protein B0H17DRAFT_1190306 [Mycena rosella]